jgi:hypothetical protein
MLAGYPALNPNDMAEYLTAMTTILLNYTSEVAAEASIDVANNCKFPPSRAELHQACERAAAREYRLAQARALGPPTRIDYLGIESPRDPMPDPVTGRHPPGTILENFGTATALYGRPIGVFEKGRHRVYGCEALAEEESNQQRAHAETAEAVRKKLGLTQEQWDAMPNTPPRAP